MKTMQKLLAAGAALAALTVGANAADTPKRIGYVVNYATLAILFFQMRGGECGS